MKFHIVNSFLTAHGGSEQGALELYRGIADRCEAFLWSAGAADPELLRANPIRHIGTARDDAPQGGTLVIHGNHYALGEWLERARPERLILFYNSVVRPELKYRLIDRLRALGELEIVYVSGLVRDWVGIPGPVMPSRIELERFSPASRPPNERFVVGRMSRDDPLKHHAGDPALYRRLAARGLNVRIMGGTCLASALGGESRIELLPSGAEPAPQFLQGLDCFLYRTSDAWTEAGGRVVAEAMACGLAVVCHRLGGYAEWIAHGVSGFLFEGDEEAERIVLELKNDPELRRRVGEAARAKMEAMYSGMAGREYFDFFLTKPSPSQAAQRGRHVDFAWELGGHTGHVATLMPIARALQARGHTVRFLLKELRAGADLEGAAGIPREGAPVWVGPVTYPNPLNFGEILHNFGYHDPRALKQLVDAWRERLWLSQAVLASVAPAAHIAARTLGIPSLEISQGFHIPPPTMPAPPLRDWQPAPRALLEQADRRIVGSINQVLAAYGVKPIATIGDLFAGRALLLTYPELDIYPERGAADYYGIPDSGEGEAVPPWPQGRGPRVFAYLYHYYSGLAPLLASLAKLDAPTLMLCRGVDPALKREYATGCVFLTEEPMSVSRLLPQCDLVVCHASHQMTAQALLAGKPVLLLATQLEQFLIMRRVVRYGAGLGIAPETAGADFSAALAELSSEPKYARKATEFAARYRAHDRGAALATMIARCEAALGAGEVQAAAISSGQRSGSNSVS